MVSVKTIRRIGAAALVFPALYHLVPALPTLIFAPALAEGYFGQNFVAGEIFFFVLGLFQLVWIRVILKSKNPTLLALGILGNLGSIVIYSLSAAGVTIFGVPPHPPFPTVVLIKTLEAIFVLASAYVLKAARSGA